MTNREKFIAAYGYDGSIVSDVLPETHGEETLGSCGYFECSESCASRPFPRCPKWWDDEIKDTKVW